MNGRPRLALPWTRLDAALVALAVLGWSVMLAHLLRNLAALPERTPIHFGLTGVPDAWGPRGLLWLLPAIATVLGVALIAVSSIPHHFNYPIAITPANAERQYRLGRGLLLALCAQVMWIFASLLYFSVETGLGRAPGLPAWWLGTALLVLVVTLTAYWLAARSARV